jgi:hypothetical protein
MAFPGIKAMEAKTTIQTRDLVIEPPPILDDFVKNPISALCFNPQSLRRTESTPPSAGFARVEVGLFTKSSP